MAYDNPFIVFNFNDAEETLYKLIIQLSKIPRLDSLSKYNKIKATDLVEISKYSKPKVYEVIKRLKEKNLIQVENIRPMFIKPLDPAHCINKLINQKNKEFTEAGAQILDVLNSLPKIDLKFPFSEVPPFSFFNGTTQYYKLLDNMLDKSKKEIVLICGYLVDVEEELLRDYMGKKLKDGLRIRLLYGGSTSSLKQFGDYFDKKIIHPNQSIIKKHERNIRIDKVLFSPALRITIIDDRELIMALKRYDEKDTRINITEISGIQSDNRDFIRTTRDTFILLRTLADVKVVQKLLGDRQ